MKWKFAFFERPAGEEIGRPEYRVMISHMTVIPAC
jgi:hypothetical protein